MRADTQRSVLFLGIRAYRIAGRQRETCDLSPMLSTMPGILSTIDPVLREKLEELATQYDALGTELEDPDVLSDHRKVRELSIKRSAIESAALGVKRLHEIEAELVDLRESADGDDAELAELARDEIAQLQDQAETLLATVKSDLVSADDRAVGSVMMELRAGTGGDEAGLWCRDLLQMYERYAAMKKWKLELLDSTVDDGVGGIRHAVVSVKGEGVWQELAFEAGVHSVKRVPATETQGRIHTSTATVAVLPEPEEVEVTIDWANDVVEHVTTAQGPGGQNVNKVATAVHLVHEPTGIEVRMQESKSQQQNRERAKRLLLARVYERERQQKQAERDASRRDQIGTGGRSEKIRTYRYQDGIVSDERLGTKFQLREVLAGELNSLMEALIEQETARRLAAL
ncbi:MAG: PCRF domain-containing protein [Phycisphaeraceae bacterium]|nr:PCRF domain-containing protein [Phycisphaerales bacterium]MCB9860638.1 PCRF domain-containing protein [Phycisphaeraceae bacterium]